VGIRFASSDSDVFLRAFLYIIVINSYSGAVRGLGVRCAETTSNTASENSKTRAKTIITI